MRKSHTLSVPITNEMHAALASAARAEERTVAQLVRKWVTERLGGEQPRLERIAIPDMSAEDVGLGPPMAQGSTKAERLAHARRLVPAGAGRFEPRVIGQNGLKLEPPPADDDDSYVDRGHYEND